MKNQNKWILGISVLFLLTIVALYGSQFAIPSSNIPSGSFISVPAYGALKCELSQTLNRAPSNGWETVDKATIKCQNTGNTLIQECDVTFKLPSENEIGGISTISEGLAYTICTEGSQCSLSNANVVKYLKHTGIKQSGNFNKEISEHITESQYIIAQYNRVSVLGNSEKQPLLRYAINFRPYQIVKYDVFSKGNGQPIPDSFDCAYNGKINELNYAIISATSGLKFQEATSTNKASLRARGAVVPYISNFVAIVPQFSLFENGDKYCYDKKIYKVDEVTTPIGTYKVADTNTNAEIGTVKCCNSGDVPTGYKCENFEKVEIKGGESCNALNPCPIVGYQPYPNKQVVYQECVSNKCLTKLKTVKCSFDIDCGKGNSCSIDPNNPSNNYCKTFGIIDYCGNGVCDYSLSENAVNCPKDCSQSSSGINLTPLYIILAIFIVAIFMVLIMKKRRK